MPPKSAKKAALPLKKSALKKVHGGGGVVPPPGDPGKRPNSEAAGSEITPIGVSGVSRA